MKNIFQIKVREIIYIRDSSPIWTNFEICCQVHYSEQLFFIHVTAARSQFLRYLQKFSYKATSTLPFLLLSGRSQEHAWFHVDFRLSTRSDIHLILPLLSEQSQGHTYTTPCTDYCLLNVVIFSYIKPNSSLIQN